MAQSKNAWMSTFSDLLLLMLTFFVLLLTMSTMEEKKLKKITNPKKGFKIKSKMTQGRSVFDAKSGSSQMQRQIRQLREKLARVSTKQQTDERQIQSLLTEIFEATNMSGRAWVDFRPNGMSVNLDGQVTFIEDTARLTRDARQFLRHFSSIIRDQDFNVAVESYLGGAQTYREREDNWELALARADETVNFLFDYGFTENRARVMGFGYSANKKDSEENGRMQYGSLLKLHILAGAPRAETLE